MDPVGPFLPRVWCIYANGRPRNMAIAAEKYDSEPASDPRKIGDDEHEQGLGDGRDDKEITGMERIRSV